MRYIWLLAVVLMLAPAAFAQNGDKQITLEDVFKKPTFRIKSVPGFNAMKDGRHYTRLDQDDKSQQIKVYDLEKDGDVTTIFDNAVSKLNGGEVKIDHYKFSDDEKKLLLYTESENIYRRSVLNRVFIYDIASKELQLLDYDKVLHATFSPDGSKVAFVKNNNLYYKDLKSGQTVPVTTDGQWNRIINGNCDWVYEEEFQFTQAFSWSPDGKYIAFYRFDESLVPMYTLPIYEGLYPTMYTYKYPKVGERNSIVQIRIYDVKSEETVNANVGKETDQYIPRIKWTNDPSKLCIFRMNRHQNKLELLLADAKTGRSREIFEENNKYYIEINDNLEFLPDGQSFIFNSEMDGYNHLYRWDWEREKLTDLTKGDYDIDEIIGVDQKRELVYYTSAEKSPLQRQLYAVDWKGRNKRVLTPEQGTHTIIAIKGFNYFLDRHTTLNQPPVYYLLNNNGEIVRTLEDNSELKEKMKDYALGKLRLVEIKGDKGRILNAWVITPPGFDDNDHKKYPVLMFQYSGPGSQQVADRFPVGYYFWHQMLAQKGYIIVCADGVGTGFRGEEFKKKTYLQLGRYESDDQIAVAKYLGTLPYVDKKRIGIWGWSYGGFMSSTCIFKGNDVFSMAMAVAPVSNWKYYDNIYTERYMRTPQENKEGYEDNAPETMAKDLKGKLLIIHGTGDDNVHFQNSVMLTEALIEANKDFESEYYPNKKHGISGGNSRYHVFKRLTDFVLNNL